MKVRFILVAVVFAFCSLSLFANGSSVSVRLTVEPSRVLPGVPASLQVVVINSGDSAVVLPGKVLLRVIPSNGSPFVAEWGPGQEHRFSGAEIPGEGADRTIPPHGQRIFMFAAREFGHPAWFYDPRLNSPGTYRLQLLLGPYDENAISRTPALDLEADIAGGFASTESVLKIDTPQGDDAILWNHLVALTKHKSPFWSPVYWSPAEAHDFANVALKYPASPYAAYAVPYFWSPSAEERLAAQRRVLDAQPATPVRENIQFLVAETEVSLAQHLASGTKPDLNRAIALYDRARSDFEALERNATDPEVRARSREQREHLPTIGDLRETAAVPPSD